MYEENKNQMLTINYFGNINDTLIGQIKTKIPISSKNSHSKIASFKQSFEEPSAMVSAVNLNEE